MNSIFYQLNYGAIIEACLASFIFAGLWFGVIIAKHYRVAMGIENAPQEKPTLLSIAGPTLCNFIVALVSAAFMRSLNIQTMLDAAVFGMVVGVGYLTPTVMTIAINPNFPRPFMYTFLNAPFFILNSLMTCLIIMYFS